MEKKPEQHLPVNETQSVQEQLEEALRARIDAARRAADYLAELFGVTGGRAGEAGGKRGGAAELGTGDSRAIGSQARSPSARPTLSPDLPAYPAAFKRCEGCGRSYTAEQWRALAFETLERLSHDLAVEIRQCTGCRATVGILVHIVPCQVARMGERGLPRLAKEPRNRARSQLSTSHAASNAPGRPRSGAFSVCASILGPPTTSDL